MSYFNRLKTFLLTLILIPFSAFVWWISMGTMIVSGGYFIFYFLIVHMNCFQDGKSSYFLKPNSEYGSWSCYSYTDKVENDIFDNNGKKVGSYQSNGKTHSGWSEDDRKYTPRPLLFIIYIFIFPILKLCSLIASFLALFTNRFYVSVKAPDDYSHEKYSRALHCLINVVVERSENGREKYIQKRMNKEEKLRIKQEQKLIKKEKREENKKTADKILGIALKILGLIIVVIVIYFITRFRIVIKFD